MILMGTQNQDSPGGVAPLIVLFALQGFTSFAFLTPALPEIAHVAQVEGGKVGDSGTGRSFSIFNMVKIITVLVYLSANIVIIIGIWRWSTYRFVLSRL